MPLAAEFGVAADAAAAKVLEAKAHAVVVLVQFVHSDLHLLLVCQRAAQNRSCLELQESQRRVGVRRRDLGEECATYIGCSSRGLRRL